MDFDFIGPVSESSTNFLLDDVFECDQQSLQADSFSKDFRSLFRRIFRQLCVADDLFCEFQKGDNAKCYTKRIHVEREKSASLVLERCGIFAMNLVLETNPPSLSCSAVPRGKSGCAYMTGLEAAAGWIASEFWGGAVT
jgi:hypothetical protein